jgi:DNA-binding NarL/FixJ family response regulator
MAGSRIGDRPSESGDADSSGHLDLDRSRTIGLVLAEAYPILLFGLEYAFKIESGFQVLACCAHGDEALRAVVRHRPDVLVLDLEIPGGALNILREVVALDVPTRVVLLAATLDEQVMLEATRLGAKGIVLKSMARQLLIQCVRKVHRGGTWLERVSAARAVERLLRHEEGQREAVAALSARELEIVRMVVSGRSNKQIGDRLAISEGTVKVHLHHVYEKLNVKGRLELTLYTRDRGFFLFASDPLRARST